eukprot:g4621.t1
MVYGVIRESSGRDIRLHTWQIWKRIYQTKFGKPNTIDVPELPLHDIDEDLILGSPAETPGDYRLLYERKLKQADSDRKQLVERLKKLRRKEAISKEQKKAKVHSNMFSRDHLNDYSALMLWIYAK